MAWSKQATILGPPGAKGDTGDTGATGVAPTGAEMQWPVATPPTGWLVEDGSSQLIASYPALSALIRSTYGGADASHFWLPDMRGVVPVGYKSGDADFGTLGGTGGEATHLLTAAESGVPAHNHSIATTSVMSVTGTLNWHMADSGALQFQYNRGQGVLANTAAAAASAHPNLQPYQVRNFVIKT